MSPDSVFAAQMWPWPDPMIKRDAIGRVLFVNAAFLQLYGGSVEDWRGNAVTGWHAPQAPGVPYRFEIRVPQAHGESVYDWIEFSLADGSALAIARDVSAVLAANIPAVESNAVQQIVQQAPVVESVATPPVAEQPVDPFTSVSHEDAISEATSILNDVTHDTPDPVVETPVVETQAEQPATAVIEEPAPVQQATPIEPIATKTAEIDKAPLESILTKNDSDFSTPDVEPEPAPVAEAAPVVEATPPAPAAEERTETRDFERRALPIENGDAVLGNNWRDAVIAKAVGAESPAAKPEAAAVATQDMDAPAPEIDGSDGPLKILLAEDNAINALLTRTLLEADGCIVDTVEDGVKAVEAAKAQHYDLIFMDMRMPNMDGLEATRKIRALDNRSKSLPIIALTANAFDDDRNACFDSGMNDFMTKPVSAEELSEMVRTWTKNRDQRMAS